jgi:putative sterol carrier protein
MVVMMAAKVSPQVEVRLAQGTSSGLASIVQQFLEQQLGDSAQRRRRASRIHGRLGLIATDYCAAVTVEFAGHQIAVRDGTREPLDASIAGTYRALAKLLQGEANPLIEHLRGRLKVSSKMRGLCLPLRVHRLMKLTAADGR